MLDWLAEKFQSVWGAIQPVIDALKWVKDKGAEALAGIGIGGTDAASAAAAGAKSSANQPGPSGLSAPRQAEVLARQGERLKRLGVPGYATGGTYEAGPIIVGERGPELRYESRGGYIAHHNALRGLAAMSQRARDLARGALNIAPPGAAPVPVPTRSFADQPGRSGLSAPRQAEVLARQGERLKKLGVPGYATGGAYEPGPIIVGERGPELRYESRGGYIAHHNALRGLVAMSRRASDLARGALNIAARGPALVSVPAPSFASVGPRNGSISYAPVYNVSINGSGLSEAELRRAIRDELQHQSRRAQADLRRLMHD